jgi:hypothetical protein
MIQANVVFVRYHYGYMTSVASPYILKAVAILTVPTSER